ncbi:TPA: hypothetical protein ACUNF5_007416 [Burkholderia orbicola]
MTREGGRPIARAAVFFGCGIALIAALVLSTRQMDFLNNADGFVSPQTAVAAGLISETEAPWSGGLVYKALADGGYEYTRGRDYLGLARKRTNVDFAALCSKLGGCQLKHSEE